MGTIDVITRRPHRALLLLTNGTVDSVGISSFSSSIMPTLSFLWFLQWTPSIFRSLRLEFAESGLTGDNSVFVTDDYSKAARKRLLNETLQLRLAQDPRLCIEVEDPSTRLRKQKRVIWNKMLLEPDENKWTESMIAMVDGPLEEPANDLEDVALSPEQVRFRFEDASRKALADYHPRMVEELNQYEAMHALVQGAKHWKIHPDNEVLHCGFLHLDNRHLNDMLGNTEAVYAKANKPNRDAPFPPEEPTTVA